MERAHDRPRVIKRYANRKLYDTVASRYVTLQHIAELIREGADVQIVDNTTKEDLTNVTLAQIIYDEQKRTGGNGAGGSGPLRALVARGEAIVSQLRESPKLAREALDELQRAADDRVRAAVTTVTSYVQHLQSEVKRLQGRIEELERALPGRRRSGPPPETDPR